MVVDHRRTVATQPAVLVGDSHYWMLKGGLECILGFDLQSESLTFIRMPVDRIHSPYFIQMRADDGELGLLAVTGTSAQLWKRKANCDGAAPWGLGGTIELNKLLSLDSEQFTWIQGDKNLAFLCIGVSNFTVQLESLQFKELSNPIVDRYYPFESVYAAGI
ncbi:uncharacterized protein [Aegilops tauschii subsp. strangulata]|uniref:uncharacterized protein n=1 Tax=Aegilops tauschii subsp. strangulata TaxID=200361 RepID=UPI001ABC986C|nr:uncharacterized protein LOC120967324 [Aegilops tauschii subsp. strangulata]